MSLPLVVIVGAPNAGKSRLFNRLAGGRRSVVHATPGVTRDPNEALVEIEGRTVRLVDTGGIAGGRPGTLEKEVARRALAAAREADLVVFLVDLKAGVTPFDLELAGRLRRQGRPILLALNKVDALRAADANRSEAWELGLGEGVEISAEHSLGIAELREAMAGHLPPGAEEGPRPEEIPVAIVGRPNTGKSSLFNRLLRSERSMVSAVPGTTRDRVVGHLEHAGRRFRLVDTAGLRRDARITDPVEALSAAVARGAVERADIVLLVIDADRGVDRQDLAVAGLAVRTYRPLVVALNKIDLLQPPALAELRERAAGEMAFASYAPILPVSALTGRGLTALVSSLGRVWLQGAERSPTPALNRLLREFEKLQPSSPRRRTLRLLYAVQEGVHPPSFVLFGRARARPHFSYRRALENFLRRRLGLTHTPLVLKFRTQKPGTVDSAKR